MYFLCRTNENGREEVTAGYPTFEEMQKWAVKQKENWHTQDGNWYVKEAERFDKPGNIVLTLTK